MRILAIDPGNVKSAYLVYEYEKIREFGIYDNEAMLSIIQATYADCMAIEMVACYGMPVGKSVFETCVWTGRFIDRFEHSQKKPATKIYRMDVKMHLCQNSRAKDGNIRQVIIDRYKPTGGGAIPQIGTKKQPGPLYGVSNDVWSALAVAITFTENQKQEGK